MATLIASAKLTNAFRFRVVDKNISAALTSSFSLGNQNQPSPVLVNGIPTVFANPLANRTLRTYSDLESSSSLANTMRYSTKGGKGEFTVSSSLVCEFPTYLEIDIEALMLQGLPEGTDCVLNFEEGWMLEDRGRLLPSGNYEYGSNTQDSPSPEFPSFVAFRTPKFFRSAFSSVFSLPTRTALRIKQLQSAVAGVSTLSAVGIFNPGKFAALFAGVSQAVTIARKTVVSGANLFSSFGPFGPIAINTRLREAQSSVSSLFTTTTASFNSRKRFGQSTMSDIFAVVCSPYQFEGIVLNIPGFATLSANVTRIEMTYNLFSATSALILNTRVRRVVAAPQVVASTNIIGNRLALAQSNITAQSSLSCIGNKPMVIASNGAGTFGLYGTVNATIQWPDGTETVATTPGSYSYDAGAVGTGIITIRGTVTKYGPGADNATYTHNSASVYSFGEIGITHLDYAFRGVNFGNSSFVPARLPTTITSLKGLFEGASQYSGRMVPNPFNTENFKPAQNWDVSNVTDMSFMFKGVLNINTTSGGGTGTGITNWNVSNVTTMESMFENASMSISIAGWNTSSLTNMKNIMKGQPTAGYTNLPTWNVSNVTNMEGAFQNAGVNNINLSTWNVGKVTNMKNMFASNGEGSTVTLTIDNWDVSVVTTMEGMFNATRFNGNITRWDTQAVTNMNSMFQGNNLFSQDLRGWCVGLIPTIPTNFGGATGWTNQPVWGTCPISLSINPTFTLTADVLNVQFLALTNISSEFTPALSATIYENPMVFVQQINGSGETSSGWNLVGTAGSSMLVDWGDGIVETKTLSSSSLTFSHTYTETGDTRFNQITFSNKTGTITQITAGTGSIMAVTDWGKGNNWTRIKLSAGTGAMFVPAQTIPSSVTNASEMFYNTNEFNDRKLRYWNVSNITNMNQMFRDMAFDQDLTKWCVSSIPTIPTLFGGSGSWATKPIWGTCPTAIATPSRIPKTILLKDYGVSTLTISTATSKFGSSSLYKSSANNRVWASPDKDLEFLNNAFTIEMWINPTNKSTVKTYYDARYKETDDNMPRLELDNSTLKYIVNNVTLISGSYTPAAGVWAHIAVCRSGTSTRLFVNGVQIGTTLTDTNVYRSGIVNLASTHRGGNEAVGYIDEVRVSNTARYTTTFTPATSAFTNDANTVMLLHFEGVNGSTYTEDDIS